MAEHQGKRSKPKTESYPIIPAFPIEKRFTGEKPLPVITNYFPFKVLSKPIYCYSVLFEPLQYELGIRKRFILLSRLKDKLGQYLFNGTNLFTQNTLSITSEKIVNEYKRQDQEVKEEFTITFTMFKVYKDNLDQHVLMLLNQIIHKSLFKLGFVQLGDHHFNPKESRNLQGGIAKWPGFSTSVQLGMETGSFLLVDYKQKLIRSETAADVFNRNKRQSQQNIEQELQGRVVLTKYNNKTYRIKKIAWDETPKNTFEQFDKQSKQKVAISYIDYYEKNYAQKITQAGLPLMIADHRMRNGKTQEIRLIPEFCCLTGVTTRELSQNRRELCKSSKDRSNEIAQFMKKFVDNAQVKEVMEKWGIQLETNPTKIDAFISPPQTLQMGKNEVQVKSDWKQIFREKNIVFKEIELKTWYFVCPQNRARTAESFIRDMKFVAQNMGIRLSDPTFLKCQDEYEDSYIRAMQQTQGIKSAQFVLILLTSTNKATYSALKHFASCELPVVSQCLTENVCQKGKTIATNIVVQLQAKLCGAPWKVKLPIPQDRYCMFVGISVLPGKQSSGSTGAFCATLDRDCVRYFTKTFFKQSVDEVGISLTKHFEKALDEYKSINGVFPDTVIFYREGVADRSYKQVTEDEINKFKKVATEKAEKAGFIYVAVNKHVQSKFFMASDRGNVPSGTIINRSIVPKDKAEFYLCSVTANQGTVNPVRYHILANETKLAEKIIVTLTHALAHMYFNWFGPVRVPAPLMYAAKAATFIGDFVRDEPQKSLEKNLFFL